MHYRRLKHLAAVALILAAATAVYAPGLDGPFIFDDGNNFLQNPGVHMQVLNWDSIVDAALSQSGVEYINRPLPRISFALNYYFAGQRFDRAVFKVTNLIIHLVNGGLVFWLSLRLMRCLEAKDKKSHWDANLWFWFPVALTTVWTLHPLQLTSVLYAVQRMTSLAGTGVLLGLIGFTLSRLRVVRGQRFGFTLMGVSIVGGTLLGVLCKENAVLIALFACLIELFFFSHREADPRTKFRLKIFYGVLVGAMALGAIIMLLAIPDLLLRLYGARTFTPVERLLTQPRVLIFYLGLIFFPNLRNFSLYHDDFALSTGLFDPLTTAISLGVVAVAAITVVITFKRRSLIAFAILWFLVGHLVESTILGLELVHEHRNYVPLFGVLFGLIFCLFQIIERRRELRRVIALSGTAVVLVLTFVTYTRASVWNSMEELSHFTVRNHPNSYRAQMEKGTVLERSASDVKDIYAAYLKASTVSPHSVSSVMRMQRILSGLIYNINEGDIIPSNSDTQPQPTRWDVPLLVNLPYLNELDQLVAQEFTDRLVNTPMNGDVMVALSEFQRCVITRVDSCPPTSRVDEWFRVVLENEAMRPIQRAGILLSYARVRAYLGDIDQAVEMVEEAFSLTDEEEVGFLIELAQLFRMLQDYDNAERVVERIAVVAKGTGRRVADYKRLKLYLAEERENYESGLQNSGQ